MAKPKQSHIADINACVSTSHHRPKEATSFREWMLANQIGISFTILAMILAVHNLYPSLRPYTAPFFQLSYYNADKGSYTQGWDDAYFVASSAIAFTAIRAIAIDWLLQPLARRAGLKKKASMRVAEQGWGCMYYAVFWPFGLYLWSQSSYWDDYAAIWDDWPSREISGPMKWYLLVQLSIWIQQILVIHIEQRRKDHYQMLTHHLITSSLLASAYIWSFYNVSNVVLSLMDGVDLLLPAAKILKYLQFENACNVAFGLMMVTWLITRHIFYPQLCWSIYQDFPTEKYGCYLGKTGEMFSSDGYPNAWGYLAYPFRDLDGPICMNKTVKWIFLSSLLALQLLSVIWFGMVIRVAVRVLRTGNAEDTRSDGEEEEEVEGGEVAVVSETSGIERRVSNGNSTRRGRVQPVDRKALLGRIGCEKPT